MSKPTTLATPSHTATQRIPYFFRKGKKDIRERQFRALFIKRGLKTRNLQKDTTLNSNISKNQLSLLFQSIFQSIIPFVGLKLRRQRRGKAQIAKIVTLAPNRGIRKALITLANGLFSEGSSSKTFSERLERILEKVHGLTTITPTQAGQAASGQQQFRELREKRDAIHQLAFRSRPYR